MAKEGRSRGFLTVFVTQKQTADAIPTAIRDVCQVGLSFGVRTMDGAVAALGDEIRQYPDVAPTNLIGREWTGVAVMRLPPGRLPPGPHSACDRSRRRSAGRRGWSPAATSRCRDRRCDRAGPMTPTLAPIDDSDLVELVRTANQPGFERWRSMVAATGGCADPIHLVGQSSTIDAATGEVLHRYDTEDEPNRRLLVACRNRRASRCAPCAEVYRADTYQLIRAGLAGGKSVPDSVAGHPRVFATLTAPSLAPSTIGRRRGRKSGALPSRRRLQSASPGRRPLSGPGRRP